MKRGGYRVTEEQWYTNKDLYCMVQSLQGDISELKTAMRETAVLIRDYNGLRQKVDSCEQLLHESQGRERGGRDTWGYVVGGIGALLAIIAMAIK